MRMVIAVAIGYQDYPPTNVELLNRSKVRVSTDLLKLGHRCPDFWQKDTPPLFFYRTALE